MGSIMVLKLSPDQRGCERQTACTCRSWGNTHGCLIKGARHKIGLGRAVGVITVYAYHGVVSFLLGLRHLFNLKLAETKNTGKGVLFYR